MNRMVKAIWNLWEERPLMMVLWLSLTLRIVAALFSRGYGWHDDHFLTIEPPHSWVEGYDYNYWLPSSHGGAFKPSGHSFTYSGIMYGIFYALETAGIEDPQWQMTFIRFLHAIFSLLTVYYSFRISETYFGKRTASYTALFLATLYFMPMLSVRNLVEMVCVPFLLGGTWFLLRSEKTKWNWILLSALFFGIAVSIRYQTVLFVAGTGLVLLFTFNFWRTLLWGGGFILLIALTQGLVDYLIWGVPFAEFMEYYTYNQTAGATDYFVREWYLYFLVIAGIFIPPFSLFLLAGFISHFKKILLLTLPVAIFFIFHSWFPNKQERFILPIIPFLLITGYGGWVCLRQVRFSGKGWSRFIHGGMVFFWVLNTIALIPLTLMYSKRSRVETMYFLGRQSDYISYIIEDSNNTRITMLPDFYAGKPNSSWRIMADIPASWTYEQAMYQPLDTRPNYMLFMYEENLVKRVTEVSRYFPLEFIRMESPGFMDRVLHELNPNNRNESIAIFKIHWTP